MKAVTVNSSFPQPMLPLLYHIHVCLSPYFSSYFISANPAWIVVWVDERLTQALVLLVAGVLTLVVCLISSCRELDNSGPSLEQNGFTADIWCTRIIVQNGRELSSVEPSLFV